MSRFELIEVFSSRVEAELARGYLKNMGIEARIVADDVDQLYPSLGSARGIKLLARSESVKEARELLDKTMP